MFVPLLIVGLLAVDVALGHPSRLARPALVGGLALLLTYEVAHGVYLATHAPADGRRVRGPPLVGGDPRRAGGAGRRRRANSRCVDYYD